MPLEGQEKTQPMPTKKRPRKWKRTALTVTALAGLGLLAGLLGHLGGLGGKGKGPDESPKKETPAKTKPPQKPDTPKPPAATTPTQPTLKRPLKIEVDADATYYVGTKALTLDEVMKLVEKIPGGKGTPTDPAVNIVMREEGRISAKNALEAALRQENIIFLSPSIP